MSTDTSMSAVDKTQHSSFRAEVPKEHSKSFRSLKRPTLRLSRLVSLDSLLEYKKELGAHGQTFEPSVHEAIDLECAFSHSASDASCTIRKARFRSIAAEVGFCFAIAMTQLISEVLISGFALVLVKLLSETTEPDSTSSFWPAAILSLVVSSTLLVWARIADM